MELLHLKYFLTVANHQHMTKAAKELMVSQPSLSKIINSLEKELNLELFDRKGRTIVLNENGKFFYENVSKSLSIIDESISTLKNNISNSQNEITLYSSAASSLISDIIVSFREKYPNLNVNIKLIQGINDDSLFDKSQADFCIYSSGGHVFSNNDYVLLDEEILLAIPYSNHLSRQKSIDLCDIKNQNFISLGSGNFKHLIESFFKDINIKPHIVLESNNAYTIRRLISSGQGISLIPKYSWQFDSYNNIKLYELNSKKYKRQIMLYDSTTSKNKEHFKIFRSFLIEFFNDLKSNTL